MDVDGVYVPNADCGVLARALIRLLRLSGDHDVTLAGYAIQFERHAVDADDGCRNSTPDLDQWLTAKQVAGATGRAQRTIRAACQNGRLRAVKRGRTWLIHPSQSAPSSRSHAPVPPT